MKDLILEPGKEAALSEEIAASVNAAQPGKCLNLTGKTSLPQALSLIAASQASISNDSGLMHVAAALGVPQVAIFGSSSPLHPPAPERQGHGAVAENRPQLPAAAGLRALLCARLPARANALPE